MAEHTDVIVIGGGCTGAGVAWDLALRGLKPILVEQEDLAHGATGHFHGLLHSGGRYVVSDPETARECIAENRILRRIAPACIESTGGFFVLTEKDDPAFAPRFLKGCRNAGIPVEEISPAEALREEPYLTPALRHVYTVPDGAIDGFDLMRALCLGIAERGGEIWNHWRVVDFIRRGGRISGVRLRDTRGRVSDNGEEREIRAEFVVNAGGAWAGQIAALASIELRLILSKGTMVAVHRRWTNRVINRCRYPTDGDILVPAKQVSIIGTTAITVPSPGDTAIEPYEIENMLSAGEALIPGFQRGRILRAYAGIRPLYQDESNVQRSGRSVTRGYAVLDHEKRDGVGGLISVVGGKLTTFRLMAEEAADLICRKMGLAQPCRTADTPLPGNSSQSPCGPEDVRHIAQTYGLPLYTVQRMVQRHGANVHRVLAEVESNPRLKTHVCICEPVIEAEIRYCVRYQWVRTLDDLRRRTRLGTGPCQGTGCTVQAAAIIADELGEGLEYARQQVADFLQERWAGRHPVLAGMQLAQEELSRAYYLCIGDFGALDRGAWPLVSRGR